MKGNIFIPIALLLTILSAISIYKLADLQVMSTKNEIMSKELRLYKVQVQDLEDIISEQNSNLKVHKELLANMQAELRKTGQSRYELQEAAQRALSAANIFEKLNNTDKELLSKYSKIYFLNEHYEPSNLVTIPTNLTWQGRNLKVKQEVLPFLLEMLKAMEDTGIDPRIVSAFRSFNTQEQLKNINKITYGTTEANKFVADQGFSEHQLGTTLDITDTRTGGLSGFENTKEYEWLVSNAYKYGFVLSYPKGNAYYAFEPWHWRFVGKDLAKRLNKEKDRKSVV